MRSRFYEPTPEENTRAEYQAYDLLPKRLRTILRCAPIEMSARKTLRKWVMQQKNTTVTAWQMLDYLKEKGR